MAVRITERTHKGWHELQKLAHAGKPQVNVGYLEDGKGGQKHGAYTNAEIGAVHEFGVPAGEGRPAIPERSHLRSTLDEKKSEIIDLQKKLLRGVFDGKLDVEKALNVLGLKVVSDIKRKITSGPGVPPPNAPSTIEAKGSDRPLVDTSQLVNSISHAVVMKVGG